MINVCVALPPAIVHPATVPVLLTQLGVMPLTNLTLLILATSNPAPLMVMTGAELFGLSDVGEKLDKDGTKSCVVPILMYELPLAA